MKVKYLLLLLKKKTRLDTIGISTGGTQSPERGVLFPMTRFSD